MTQDYEPEELKIIRLEREKRRDEYLQANKLEIREMARLLMHGIDFNDPPQRLRDNMADLAQYHVDLENAIEGNG